MKGCVYERDEENQRQINAIDLWAPITYSICIWWPSLIQFYLNSPQSETLKKFFFVINGLSLLFPSFLSALTFTVNTLFPSPSSTGFIVATRIAWQLFEVTVAVIQQTLTGFVFSFFWFKWQSRHLKDANSMNTCRWFFMTFSFYRLTFCDSKKIPFSLLFPLFSNGKVSAKRIDWSSFLFSLSLSLSLQQHDTYCFTLLSHTIACCC